MSTVSGEFHRSIIELREDIDDKETMKIMNAFIINESGKYNTECKIINSDYNKEISEIIQQINLTTGSS